MTDHPPKIKIHEILTSFTLMEPANTVIIDVEVTDGQICIFGYYHTRGKHIHQLVFLDPISPSLFSQSALFHEIIAGDVTIAAYNCNFERSLLQLPQDQPMIELQPAPYYPKEKFIQLKSLDQTPAKFLPPWSPTTIKQWVFHNYSCLIKEIILLQGKKTFAKPNTKELFMNQIRRLDDE